jgi:hypothetical protein
MKPTRTCNWPPRLDVALRPDLRGHRPPPRERRPARALHPALRLVLQLRWPGRRALQRRFEHAPDSRLGA